MHRRAACVRGLRAWVTRGLSASRMNRCATLTGLILAPMLLAPPTARGIQFVPSFALGVLLAAPLSTLALTCTRHITFTQARRCTPTQPPMVLPCPPLHAPSTLSCSRSRRCWRQYSHAC